MQFLHLHCFNNRATVFGWDKKMRNWKSHGKLTKLDIGNSSYVVNI